jgi:hypothetical protein
MPTKFNMTRDLGGYNGFGLQPTDTAYSVTLAANTDTTLTVPATSSIGGAAYYSEAATNPSYPGEPRLLAIFYFTPGTEVWVARGTIAAVPAGDTFAATLSEGNPSAWEVSGGDVIHCITAGTGVSVGIRFYWIT